MGKKLPYTPKSRVRSSLRQLWLRSRERAATLRRDDYSCVECGKRQSTAKGKECKIEVHHRNGIEWKKIEEYIYKHLLVNPEHLECQCRECHRKTTELQRKIEGK